MPNSMSNKPGFYDESPTETDNVKGSTGSGKTDKSVGQKNNKVNQKEQKQQLLGQQG